MSTIAARILAALAAEGALDDDDLAARLGVRRQSVNPVARALAEEGRLHRYRGRNSKWTNDLNEPDPTSLPVSPPVGSSTGHLTEDEVKEAVRAHLEGQGYQVSVVWGRVRGIDIEAVNPQGHRLIIEAKGEVTSDQQQGNYFVGALGELVQRMNDPEATYALALPDNRRYRGLVNRLPALARERLGLAVYWVTRDDAGLQVEVEAD